MPIFTSHPIRTIRIEPRPDVAAFHDGANRLIETIAGVLAACTILLFVAQFIRAYVQGTL